jgi:hypothetical protein
MHVLLLCWPLIIIMVRQNLGLYADEVWVLKWLTPIVLIENLSVIFAIHGCYLYYKMQYAFYHVNKTTR